MQFPDLNEALYALAFLTSKARIVCAWLSEVTLELANEKGPADQNLGLIASALSLADKLKHHILLSGLDP